jgi:hypothetical protein
MKRVSVAAAAIAAFFTLIGALFASSVPNPTIVSKNKDGTNYKVVYKGTLKLDKGDTYSGVSGYILNDDDGKTKVTVTVVSVTPPALQNDGTYLDGSYEFYTLTAIQGNWIAVCNMDYLSGGITPANAIGNTKFTLP